MKFYLTIRTTFLAAATFLLPILTRACPACEKAQPRILRGITHGAGPESRWDYVIAYTVAIITLLTLFYSIKWLIRPGETGTNHIKNFIINHDQYEG